MSTITLDSNLLSVLAAPVNTYLPAPIDPELAVFVKLVNSGVISAPTPVQVQPASKPARKAADKKAVKRLVKTLNGGMMDSTPGTITSGQLEKLIALCKEINEPLTAQEIKDMRTWSMAYASDYRYDILNG